MNNHLFATSEHGRKIDCAIMMGVVDQVDLTQNPPVATVDVDDFTTDWLPWTARRAGSDADWWAPEPGEQVVVLSPYGDPSQGVIIGSIYQSMFPPPSQSADQWRKQFKDGTYILYDRSSHALTVDTTQSQGTITINCQAATVKAASSVTIDTPAATFTGNVTINGNTEMKGNADVQGNTTVQAITSVGVDISNKHYHDYSGNPTTPPVG